MPSYGRGAPPPKQQGDIVHTDIARVLNAGFMDFKDFKVLVDETSEEK